MKTSLAFLMLIIAATAAAQDLTQLYEKAYFLETAKGQTEEALDIYRQIATTKATDENRTVILKALNRLQYQYNFPKSIEFETGGSSFQIGDSIEIENVLGSTEEFQVGNTYLVKGRYKLDSRDTATISVFVTATGEGEGHTGISPEQQAHVKKGMGTFELSITIPYKGWPHVSFYPNDGGNGFGGVYFGNGEWLLKEIPWSKQSISLQSKVDSFDMKHGTLTDVVSIFGLPVKYVFGKEIYTRDNLPAVFVMIYPEKFTILMNNGRVEEFRFEGSKAYNADGIQVGTTLEKALDRLGQPKATVKGEKCDFQEGVLYMDSKGVPEGHAYYATKGLRLFFMHNRVIALYITDNMALK